MLSTGNLGLGMFLLAAGLASHDGFTGDVVIFAILGVVIVWKQAAFEKQYLKMRKNNG